MEHLLKLTKSEELGALIKEATELYGEHSGYFGKFLDENTSTVDGLSNNEVLELIDACLSNNLDKMVYAYGPAGEIYLFHISADEATKTLDKMLEPLREMVKASANSENPDDHFVTIYLKGHQVSDAELVDILDAISKAGVFADVSHVSGDAFNIYYKPSELAKFHEAMTIALEKVLPSDVVEEIAP